MRLSLDPFRKRYKRLACSGSHCDGEYNVMQGMLSLVTCSKYRPRTQRKLWCRSQRKMQGRCAMGNEMAWTCCWGCVPGARERLGASVACCSVGRVCVAGLGFVLYVRICAACGTVVVNPKVTLSFRRRVVLVPRLAAVGLATVSVHPVPVS